jgi:glycosyltransferase involved in cell wall biosynthesis
MRGLGYARRVPLAVSGALRRFAQDPARGRVALERAVSLGAGSVVRGRIRGVIAASETPQGPAAVDRAVASDRYDDALEALAAIPVDSPDRPSCELAVAGLGGRLTDVATSHAIDSRGRRAVRAARRQLSILDRPIGVGPSSARSADVEVRNGRVLHVVINSLPRTQAGSTIRTQRVARAQRDLGWDAHVVTRPGYPVTHGDLWAADTEFIDGVPYHRLLPTVMPSDDHMQQAYASMLAGLVERLRPAVLHAASDHANAVAALQVGRARGIPVAYEARTFFEDMWLARHGGQAAADSDTFALLRQRHTDVLLAADVVTTLGARMRDEIISRGVAPERVFVVPNAVPTDYLETRDVAAARRSLGLESAYWVGSVATINAGEGLDTMLDAVATLRGTGLDARALVVGDGPDLRALEDQARALGVPLVAPGRIPVADVRVWFDALDVFALPRRDSAVHRTVTPLKPLEAQARGIPVVGSDLPAIAEVLAPGSPLVAAGDVEALAQALSAWADPAIRDSAGQQARAWVATTRTWPSVMEAYRAAYSWLGVRM